MDKAERRLLTLFRALPEAKRDSLLDYAEFLQSHALANAPAALPSQPLDIPRPAEESVVKAIKRLMSTYPMLDRDKLVQDTANLMSQHVVHKRPAVEVIDELEITFRRQYELHLGAGQS